MPPSRTTVPRASASARVGEVLIPATLAEAAVTARPSGTVLGCWEGARPNKGGERHDRAWRRRFVRRGTPRRPTRGPLPADPVRRARAPGDVPAAGAADRTPRPGAADPA